MIKCRFLGNAAIELIGTHDHILIDPSFIEKPEKGINKIFITHGHSDHVTKEVLEKIEKDYARFEEIEVQKTEEEKEAERKKEKKEEIEQDKENEEETGEEGDGNSDENDKNSEDEIKEEEISQDSDLEEKVGIEENSKKESEEESKIKSEEESEEKSEEESEEDSEEKKNTRKIKKIELEIYAPKPVKKMLKKQGYERAINVIKGNEIVEFKTFKIQAIEVECYKAEKCLAYIVSKGEINLLHTADSAKFSDRLRSIQKNIDYCFVACFEDLFSD